MVTERGKARLRAVYRELLRAVPRFTESQEINGDL